MVLPAVVRWLMWAEQVRKSKCFLFECLKEFSKKKFHKEPNLHILGQLTVKLDIFLLLDRNYPIITPLVVKIFCDMLLNFNVDLFLVIELT
jgi:hypothetical protein